MRVLVILASLMLCFDAAFAETRERSASEILGSHTQVAQNCGYFAILGCFRSRGEAIDWNNRIQGGRVINTSRDEYPNFRPGFFCVMAGPTSQPVARSIAQGWRGIIPDAYVKNSC